MLQLLRFKRKRYTNLTAQSFIVLAFAYLTIVISDTFAGRSWRRNATNYWRKKKDKSSTVRLHCLCSPPVVVHRRVVYLCHGTACRDVHVRTVRSSTGPRASTCVSPLFLICASNHAAPAYAHVDVVLANIDSEKRRTMALIFCFQWPLCRPRTATEHLLSTPVSSVPHFCARLRACSSAH